MPQSWISAAEVSYKTGDTLVVTVIYPMRQLVCCVSGTAVKYNTYESVIK
ncbi:hypothetical protein PSAC2689_120019 [Paraburkholderia sacchari]